MGYRMFMEILRWYGILKRAKSSKFYRIFFFARRVHILLDINATVSFFIFQGCLFCRWHSSCQERMYRTCTKVSGDSTQKTEGGNSWSWWKRKLTDAMIDKYQNYYGIAICSNAEDLNGMKKAIHASFFHCASSEWHDFQTHCPSGPLSWCGYMRDRNSFEHGPGLPDAVIAKVKPVYQRLSEDSLLEKCLHGKNQNQNEAANGIVWECIPKEVFVGADLLEFALFDAVSHFNIGATTVLLHHFNIGARTVLLHLKALKIPQENTQKRGVGALT